MDHSGGPSSGPRKKLYKVIVLNLTEKTNKSHIEEIFSAYGAIDYVDLVKG